MAEAGKFYWLKLKDDFFTQPKIKKLRRIAGGDTYTIIYLKMQLLSLKNNGILDYQQIEPTFAEEIALTLDEDVDNVKVTLQYLVGQGLIESNDTEFLLFEAAESIGTESKSAERVRRFREKNKVEVLQCNADVTPCNIDCNAPVTKCNTEIERRDKREEIRDRDKREEIEGGVGETSTGRERPTHTRFTKPTLSEVKAYCEERQNHVDAQRFIDYYESKGWLVGKSPMKDWKAAVRTWEGNGYAAPAPKQSSKTDVLRRVMERYENVD